MTVFFIFFEKFLKNFAKSVDFIIQMLYNSYNKHRKRRYKMQKRITKFGNSAGIVLNKAVLQVLGFEIGEVVEMVYKKGQIIIKKKEL